jgi:hypothetical protein
MTGSREYHLIETYRGLSHGGFTSLKGARQFAREEAMEAWDIFRGNAPVERHDPCAAPRERIADPVDLRTLANRCIAVARRSEPRLADRLSALALTYIQLACELERNLAIRDAHVAEQSP